MVNRCSGGWPTFQQELRCCHIYHLSTDFQSHTACSDWSAREVGNAKGSKYTQLHSQCIRSDLIPQLKCFTQLPNNINTNTRSRLTIFSEFSNRKVATVFSEQISSGEGLKQRPLLHFLKTMHLPPPPCKGQEMRLYTHSTEFVVSVYTLTPSMIHSPNQAFCMSLLHAQLNTLLPLVLVVYLLLLPHISFKEWQG